MVGSRSIYDDFNLFTSQRCCKLLSRLVTVIGALGQDGANHRFKVVLHFGAVPTMIERDANIPPLDELLAELTLARQVAARALEDAA